MFPPPRYSDVPSAITISVADEEGGQLDVEIPLDEDIQDDPTELCAILENEKSLTSTWVKVAVAYAKHKKIHVAIDVLSQAIHVFARARGEDRLSILNGLCWLYLLKCREAPRIMSDTQTDPDTKTKDFYLQAATSVLNDASRISPSHPPLFLARGVLYLLRASLQGPSTTAGTNAISPERMETLKQAAKCFEDALRASGGKNLMAKMGKARVHYSMGKWADALKTYQNVLESSPDLIDPDPRIGIGCCFWQLGFKDDAAAAWQRSLELNPKSKIALILLGIYNLQLTANLPSSDPKFVELYKKATNQYISPATKLDNQFPLTCATLGSHFLIRRDFAKAETVATRAIELTDVNAIASDGWYLRAKKAHHEENTAKAAEYYSKSDQARGGEERGFIPAKFGLAQMNVLMSNYGGAKFRLEKILQQSPTLEAQTLLGTLYAEDVFAAQNSKSAEDKSAELKKALKYLETVQSAWKDPKKKVTPDQSVLLNLARLYEADHPEKSLKCLEEVEQMELDAIPDEDYPEDVEEEFELKAALRELLPPQLLNNMGCFHFQAERFVRARELFQAALNACVKAASRDETIDTDALVTSISYNLGRTYEAEGMNDEAKVVYDNLLKRHTDYVDARLRLTYISLRQSPQDDGPRAMKELFKENEDNIEVRALYGWYVNKSKKRTQNFATDDEQRLYKHTLQKSDKHDRYSLMGMGNIHLAIAREMPRSSEQEKEKRRKGYERAVEFFDKVLQLDPKNAYAAQGIAIALVEDKKDYSAALQIFTKVKETLKDHSVFVNLGHTYCEIKQYARAIENYEAGLSKGRQNDPKILACLGRTWYLRARHERSIAAYRTALDYSKQALKVAPSDLNSQFNVAFIQFQIAQNIIALPERDRTLEEVDDATHGLTEAIEALEKIAKEEAPPFPRSDITSRANMGRNTMAKQLERARDKQATYEGENASKLDQARRLREVEVQRREEEKRRVEEQAIERKRKILEEQERVIQRDRELMERRGDEERRRMEDDEDKELRKAERRARGPKGPKRKKKDADSDTDGLGSGTDDEPRSRRRRTSASGTEGLSDEERPREKKKRKLARKSEPSGKYKSAEFIDDDSDDGDADLPADDTEKADAQLVSEDEGAASVSAAPRPRKGRVVDDEDEDEDDGIAAPKANGDVAMDEDEDE
ncbi:protein prenylyltransferase [Cucurbitaria berberidis CBS 394.84]|uniref:Protein prenylyltransferase n=1 Tax=Cucurbitaria berberidis CBS 394.84 TaxID=1168544 RepID=A0A9P4GTL2_9PLEO|nr:protein prenylyltransferase [Cucurbitaria berberidis CBS 394.84]KAF1851049.1 protein prenylyltransferase [Cucurbitaria berberidis CBS 394.84]